MKPFRPFSILLTIALVGCAASRTGEPRESRDSNRISTEEMRKGPRSNALALVETLRPRWLQLRGPSTFDARRETPVMVYVDGVRLGGPEQLRRIPVPTIDTIQYLNPGDASSRFGFDHMNGAILVTTRVGRTPDEVQ